MMQIGCDRDGRVFVRWQRGGPWTVLERDGSVSSEPTDLGATPWFAGQNAEDDMQEQRVLAAAERATRPSGSAAPRRAPRPGSTHAQEARS